MISANRSALVWGDVDAADFDVLEVVQTAKADAVGVVLEIDGKLNLRPLRQ